MLVPVQMQTRRRRRTDEYIRVINTLRVIKKKNIYIVKNIILG